MGVKKGLAAIKQYEADQEARREAAQSAKVPWLNIKNGETVEVRFLQELDEGAQNYSAKNGIGFIAMEHASPSDFRKRALYTIEEGACYGCEQRKAAYARGDKDAGNGWKIKQTLYINVLVRRGDKEEVAVMSQGNGPKAVVVPMLIDQAIDESTVTDRWWKIKRMGEGTATTYIPKPGKPDTSVDPEDYELTDLTNCYRDVPYEDQEAHYAVVATRPDEEQEVASTSAGSVDADEEW